MYGLLVLFPILSSSCKIKRGGWEEMEKAFYKHGPQCLDFHPLKQIGEKALGFLKQLND